MEGNGELQDIVGAIIAFEQGELSAGDTLKLFAVLVQSGQAWTLQGFYGRTAHNLIVGGYLTREGELTQAAQDVIAAGLEE